MRDNILIRVDEHRDIDYTSLTEKTYSVVLYRNPGTGEKPLAYLYSSDNPDMARGVRDYLITRMPLDRLMDIIDDLPTRLPGEAVKGKVNEGKYKSAYSAQAKRTINLVTAIQRVLDIWDDRECSVPNCPHTLESLPNAMNELKKEVTK